MLSMCVKRVLVTSAVFLSTGLANIAAADGDPARGKQLADTCEGCHAVATYNNVYPTYHVPRIAGQSAVYIANALRLYRSGERPHPTMVAQAASLSDKDIDDIAAYVAEVGGDNQNAALIGNPPEKASICASCHGESGRSSIAENPTLAGQHQDYLRQALSDYLNGNRKGPNATVMQAQLMNLESDDLAAIAAFYASQPGLKILPRD